VPDTPHLLLTSLGTSPRETTYELDGRRTTRSFSPLALCELLPAPERPDRVIVLVTPEAEERSYSAFSEGVRALGVEVHSCAVPGGGAAEDLAGFLRRAAEQVPAGVRLSLDVTHGLRHHPFVFYSLALYLRTLRDVRIEGAWYGMLEGGEKDSPKPIVDLRPALELADWFHAVRLFRDLGSATAVSALVEPLHRELRASAERSGTPDAHRLAGQVGRLAKQLDDVSFAYASALPLELGRAAHTLQSMLAEGIPESIRHRIPLAEELTARMREAATALAFSERPAGRGEWKRRVALTDAELERQHRVIELYLERDQVPLALGMMREWVVSRVARSKRGGEVWLDRTVRRRAEQRLVALGELVRSGKSGQLDQDQRWWGEFWNRIADLRNAFLHQGMRPQEVPRPTEQLEAIRANWSELATQSAPTLGGGRGRLLISPQGTSPGVLFNALRAPGLAIERCVVICSEESRPSVDEAAAQAGFRGELLPLVMADPHTGAGEIEALVAQAEDELLMADDIVANMTGGTTMMGVLVQALVEKAGRLDRTRRRFVLLDWRPPAEQRAKPWIQCEVHWLDTFKESADDED
jgi:CRISPR-associated DxTHG motif protein